MTAMLRVMVHDAWDTVRLPWRGEQSLAEVKAEALSQARVSSPPGDYVIKWRGATLRDDGATVASSGITPGGALIVLHRRRRPLR